MAPKRTNKKKGKETKKAAKGKKDIPNESASSITDKSKPEESQDDRPKVGLLDLPNEIITRIAQFAEKRYALMRTCKQLCLVVGKHMYAVELPTTCFGCKGVLAGLEHHRHSRSRPFGRELKRELLSAATTISYHVLDHIHDAASSIDFLNTLAKLDFIVFDRVKLHFYGYIDVPYDGPYDGRAMHLLQAVASICRPQHVVVPTLYTHRCYTFDYNIVFSSNLRAKGSLMLDQPQIAHHSRIGVHGCDIHLIVCHGMVNRVPLVCDHYHQRDSVASVSERIVPVLRRAHPEIYGTADVRMSYSESERRCRDATTWEFAITESYGDAWIGSGVVPDILTQLEIALPELKGRMDFVDGHLPGCPVI